MAQLSNIGMSQTGFADREAKSPHADKYHPRCGKEHSHKSNKAVIGIALLIVLSFVLYGITGHANEPATTETAPQTVSQPR